jgi:hypothetical protein
MVCRSTTINYTTTVAKKGQFIANRPTTLQFPNAMKKITQVGVASIGATSTQYNNGILS